MKTFICFFLILMCQAWAQEDKALLSDMIPHPFYQKQLNQDNQVMHLPDGMAAMQLRIEMIRRAQKQIEVEYFIFNNDMAGKIISRELIAASQRGVKVRILVDKSLPIFVLNNFYAKEFAKNGVEVRYYNKASIVRISTVQFRNHRKLLSVDDSEAITGGRNIGDDYFDLSEKFNFNDTDIYVRGPIVKVIRESFDAYFEHKISERPKLPRPEVETENEKYLEKTAKAEAFFKLSKEEEIIREKMATIGKKRLEAQKIYTCPEITYVTDAPGANFFSRLNPKFDEKYKFVRKTLFDKLSRVDKSVLISSPYLIANSHSNKLMKSILKRGVKISVYTNSLASTDAVYVAANLYYDAFKWVRRGIDIHLHDGLYTNDNPDLDEVIQRAKWGTHSKVQVYESSDSTEAMIGTYNIDNRSNFYNAEMAIFCKGNDEFTKEVKDNILKLAQKGIQLNGDGSATDRDGNKKSVWGSNKKDLKVMRLIFLPSWLLKFLL